MRKSIRNFIILLILVLSISFLFTMALYKVGILSTTSDFLVVFGIFLFIVIVVAFISKIISTISDKQKKINSLVQELEDIKNNLSEVKSQAAQELEEYQRKIDNLQREKDTIKNQYETLKDRYFRVQILYPTADQEVTNMIEEIRGKDISLAEKVDAIISNVINLPASKDILSQVSNAFYQYNELSATQKSYIKSDIKKLQQLRDQCILLNREYFNSLREGKHQRRWKDPYQNMSLEERHKCIERQLEPIRRRIREDNRRNFLRALYGFRDIFGGFR